MDVHQKVFHQPTLTHPVNWFSSRFQDGGSSPIKSHAQERHDAVWDAQVAQVQSSVEAELMTCAILPYLALVDFEALAGIEQRVKDLSLQMRRPQECHPSIARNHWTGFVFNAGQQKHQVYAVARFVRPHISHHHTSYTSYTSPSHPYLFPIIEPQQGTICRNIFAIISFTVAGCLLWAWYYDQLPPDQQRQANTTGLE